MSSIGGNTLHSKPEPKLSILPNSENDKDLAIRKHSHLKAREISNKIHSKESFVSHGDWKRIVDGNIIIYYEPVTNVISSSLPDGYPIDMDDFLYTDYLQSSDSFHLNFTVCKINHLISKVRQQLDLHRHNQLGDDSSHSLSSNMKWNETDSFSQPSGISYRSESLSGTLFNRNAGVPNAMMEEDIDDSWSNIERLGHKENARQFLNDLSHNVLIKRKSMMNESHFDRINSSSTLMTRRSTSGTYCSSNDSSTILSELKNMLFDGVLMVC